MTLDCPGCQSKLKLDPAKLPPGATAAVCPKCRTKILLPGTAGAGEITVQCGHCSSRLKVKVAKLRPRASKSRCPKCGGAVDLPAAPAGASDSPATRVIQAPPPGGSRPGAPAPAPPASAASASAMTRRLDAKEMGMLLGGAESAGPGRDTSPAGQRAPAEPIPDSAPPPESFGSSGADLGRLIDEKVDALGSAPPKPPPPPPRTGEPSVEDLPIEIPASSSDSLPFAGGLDPDAPAPAPAHAPPKGAEPAGPPSRGRPPQGFSSSSGSRAAPTFSSVMPAAKPPRGGGRLLPFVFSGLFGGAIVALAITLGAQMLPPGLSPPVPEPIAEIATSEALGLTLVVVLLSAISGLFAGLALPPEGEGSGGGASIFRCTVAAGLVGLLAGVAISLVRGGSDLASMAIPAASWTVSLIISGLLTGLIARFFASR